MRPEQVRILVVDDEPDLRAIFTSWFNLSGFTNVRTAANGMEALAVLQSETIDVLVSDVRMPVMDGPTLVRCLAELAIGVPTIIFVSGFGDIDVREMYGLGVEAYLPKPFDRKEFISRIEEAIYDRVYLWISPMVPAPRQTIEFHVKNGSDSASANQLILGRGGFCITNADPMSLSKTSFSCHFADVSVDDKYIKILSGHGHVRWYSRVDRMAGIEFAYLDPSCRLWVCEEIAATDPRSFIPSGPGYDSPS